MENEITRCDKCGNCQNTIKPWKHIPKCRKCSKPMKANHPAKELQMYRKDSLKYGYVTDTETEDYDTGQWVYLPHSCDKWVIGGIEQLNQLIADLQEMRKKIK